MVLHQSKNNDIRKARNTVLQQNNVKYIIKQSQQYMLNLVENLSSYEAFDNTVKPHDCIDRLVAHRISSKFHIEDPSVASDLQSVTFSNYIDFDNNLPLSIDITVNEDLIKARRFLYRVLKDFKVDFSDVDYQVTPGETYHSTSGEVSILAKLFDKRHWTVTANCLDDSCVFIYNNVSFKRAAKQHIGALTRKERRSLYQRFKHTADVGFHIFRHLLIDRVLTIVDGARASSVPKSNDKRRFINIEAMFAVILQRCVAHEVLVHLAMINNDLANTGVKFPEDITGVFKHEVSAQKFHGMLIADNRFSTIDFSNASDSVTLAAVGSMFPKHVSDILFRLRSHYVVIDGEFHAPHKLSSMGNGFTFEIMTLLLYAIGRSMTHEVRVYGDDVIIPNEFANRFLGACELIEFRINKAKSFINSFFRESCGYFYSDHIKDYITSFDFGQINNLSDVIITCNKLTVVIESGQISPELLLKLMNTRDQISALIHASRKGPLPNGERMQRKFLALYIFDEGFEKKQKRSAHLTALRNHYVRKNMWHFDDCQISTKSVSLIYAPFFVPQGSRHVFSGTKGLEILLPALYSGKRLKAVIKGKGKWIDLPAFVYPDGTVTLLSNLLNTKSNIWCDRLMGVVLAHERK